MDVVLLRDIPDDAMRGQRARDPFHSLAPARDECDSRPAINKRPNQGKPQAGRAPGYRYAQVP
jgi:hypothetical protein